jgi:hypothetical protein
MNCDFLGLHVMSKTGRPFPCLHTTKRDGIHFKALNACRPSSGSFFERILRGHAMLSRPTYKSSFLNRKIRFIAKRNNLRNGLQGPCKHSKCSRLGHGNHFAPQLGYYSCSIHFTGPKKLGSGSKCMVVQGCCRYPTVCFKICHICRHGCSFFDIRMHDLRRSEFPSAVEYF